MSLSASFAPLQVKDAVGTKIDTLGRRWSGAMHPRDARGKFIQNGGMARVFGIGLSRVLRTYPDMTVEVQGPDGTRRRVKASSMTMVRGPDGKKPIGPKTPVRPKKTPRFTRALPGQRVAEQPEPPVPKARHRIPPLRKPVVPSRLMSTDDLRAAYRAAPGDDPEAMFKRVLAEDNSVRLLSDGFAVRKIGTRKYQLFQARTGRVFGRESGIGIAQSAGDARRLARYFAQNVRSASGERINFDDPSFADKIKNWKGPNGQSLASIMLAVQANYDRSHGRQTQAVKLDDRRRGGARGGIEKLPMRGEPVQKPSGPSGERPSAQPPGPPSRTEAGEKISDKDRREWGRIDIRLRRLAKRQSGFTGKVAQYLAKAAALRKEGKLAEALQALRKAEDQVRKQGVLGTGKTDRERGVAQPTQAQERRRPTGASRVGLEKRPAGPPAAGSVGASPATRRPSRSAVPKGSVQVAPSAAATAESTAERMPTQAEVAASAPESRRRPALPVPTSGSSGSRKLRQPVPPPSGPVPEWVRVEDLYRGDAAYVDGVGKSTGGFVVSVSKPSDGSPSISLSEARSDEAGVTTVRVAPHAIAVHMAASKKTASASTPVTSAERAVIANKVPRRIAVGRDGRAMFPGFSVRDTQGKAGVVVAATAITATVRWSDGKRAMVGAGSMAVEEAPPPPGWGVDGKPVGTQAAGTGQGPTRGVSRPGNQGGQESPGGKQPVSSAPASSAPSGPTGRRRARRPAAAVGGRPRVQSRRG